MDGRDGVPELREATALLGEVFELLEVSEPYPNRGAGTLHRLYVEVTIPAALRGRGGPDNGREGRAHTNSGR
jgi:hypothetical protein